MKIQKCQYHAAVDCVRRSSFQRIDVRLFAEFPSIIANRFWTHECVHRTTEEELRDQHAQCQRLFRSTCCVGSRMKCHLSTTASHCFPLQLHSPINRCRVCLVAKDGIKGEPECQKCVWGFNDLALQKGLDCIHLSKRRLIDDGFDEMRITVHCLLLADYEQIGAGVALVTRPEVHFHFCATGKRRIKPNETNLGQHSGASECFILFPSAGFLFPFAITMHKTTPVRTRCRCSC